MATMISRRAMLGGLTAAAVAAPPAGCSATETTTSGGGRLRAAFAAGGSQEKLDPPVLPLFVDQARATACSDTLAGWGQDMTAER
jgi:peptide/nickel transport system substrate-binding protein